MDFCGFRSGKYLVDGLWDCASLCLVTTDFLGVTSLIYFHCMNFRNPMHKVTAISK